MLNTWSEKKKKKEKRKLGKKEGHFIVQFKISEFIWEVKCSAP